jgi:protein OS-9
VYLPPFPADISYCHNKDIRQFKEKTVPHPHAEGFVPQEDKDFDAYTLGVAHPRKTNEVAEATASFGQSHASRYLVQRWTDGTRCDLTGKPREIEVQVYCSMTGTDMIYMVNEVAICLCSLPGFRPATAADITPAPVRCREVVPDDEFADWAERRDDRLRIGEKEKETDARLASQEQDPQLKIDGLKGAGLSQEDLSAILQAAFGGGNKEKEKAKKEEEAAAEGGPELYVLEWEDTDGESVPVNVESVPPTEGESRRAFLKRLRALIEKELEAGKAGKESGPASERTEEAAGAGSEQQHEAEAPPAQRDEL